MKEWLFLTVFKKITPLLTLKSKGVYIYIFNLGNTYKILIKSRSKSVPMIGRKMGLTPTLVRTYIGVTTELLEHHTF